MIIISTSFCWRRAAGDWLREHPQNAGANGIPPSPPPTTTTTTHTHALKNTLQMYFQNCNFATKGLKMAAGGETLSGVRCRAMGNKPLQICAFERLENAFWIID